jgi:uncharacterized membrane protein YphA (DoxX/SURF4 family)
MPLPAWAIATPVIAGCGALLWAGLEKARNRTPLAQTAASLGLPPRLATATAILTPIAELGSVATIVAGVTRYVASGLLMSFGLVFAMAAAWSMITGRVVACACFGASRHKLGWRQLAALPLWGLAGLASLHLPNSTVRDRLAVLALGMPVLVALRALSALRHGAAARSDRRAIPSPARRPQTTERLATTGE